MIIKLQDLMKQTQDFKNDIWDQNYRFKREIVTNTPHSLYFLTPNSFTTPISTPLLPTALTTLSLSSFSEGARQGLEILRIDTRHRSATLIQSIWRAYHCRRRWPTLRRNLELRARTRTVRPRPQPIACTPPPDAMERCDPKTIQQTCNLFGLDLVRFDFL